MNGGAAVANGSTISVEEEEELVLTAVLEPSGITGTVIWSSEADAIATVTPASGLSVTVKGISKGSSLITVIARNDDNTTSVIRTFTVEVREKAILPVTAITVKIEDGAVITGGANLDIYTGDMINLIVELDVPGTIDWANSNSTAVSLETQNGNSKAVLEGLVAGTANFTVSAGNSQNDNDVEFTFMQESHSALLIVF